MHGTNVKGEKLFTSGRIIIFSRSFLQPGFCCIDWFIIPHIAVWG